jgi:hypothetical protein
MGDGFEAEPAVAADGAGITAWPGMSSLQPAPLLNAVVRPKSLAWYPGDGLPLLEVAAPHGVDSGRATGRTKVRVAPLLRSHAERKKSQGGQAAAVRRPGLGVGRRPPRPHGSLPLLPRRAGPRRAGRDVAQRQPGPERGLARAARLRLPAAAAAPQRPQRPRAPRAAPKHTRPAG